MGKTKKCVKIIKYIIWGTFYSNTANETIHKNYAYGFTTSKFLNEQGLNLWANIIYIVMNHKWICPHHFKIRSGL